MKAAGAVERLFDWCRMPDDLGDPKVYLAGATQILAEYPDEVIKAICTPASGTRLLPDFPTLRQLRDACEAEFAPIERHLARERAHADAVRELPRPKRTAEQQARIDAQVAEARRKLGIGVAKSGAQTN